MLTITRPPCIAHEVDDDLPNCPPEVCPLASAQAKRAARLPVVITDISGPGAPAAPAGRPGR